MRFEDPVPTPTPQSTPVAEESATLLEMFTRRVEATPDRVAFRIKQDDRWVETTWRESMDQARAIASFLVGLGVDKGEKIAIIGDTCPKWCISDLAGLLAGAVTVGAYPTLAAPQLAYLLQHSDARVVFVAGAAERDRVIEIWHQCPMLERIVVWDDPELPSEASGRIDGRSGDRDKVVAYSEVLKTEVDRRALEERAQAVAPDDCAIIVYTSGTTGPPKGAMISHANVLALVRAGVGFPFLEHEESFSFLPMAHVAERVLGLYQRTNHATSTTYASSIPAVLEEVKEVRPTLFGSVPRIFEKAHARIQSGVQSAPPTQQRVFRWAESVGLRCVEHWQTGRPRPWLLRLQYAIADRLVFAKVRQAFGGRVRFFVTGAAPIPEEVLRFFWAAGFPIFETYGMTECTAVSHINLPDRVRLGSVGKALSIIECKLADDGEVLVRGPTVFLGYYKNEEATREVIDDEGWLHTGDVGKIDDDGYLFIVDRKKHIIITAGGKNLTPANIENEIKSTDPLISQVHAHGDRRPYITALVTLGPSEAVACAVEHGLATQAEADTLHRQLLENPLARPEGLDALMAKVTELPEIRARVAKAVAKGNAQLARVERIKRVYLLDRELSVERDELTPTLKAKRKNIEESFKEQFDRLYEDEGFGIVIEGR
jgi:long-chain acyl-CoA synthetase